MRTFFPGQGNIEPLGGEQNVEAKAEVIKNLVAKDGDVLYFQCHCLLVAWLPF